MKEVAQLIADLVRAGVAPDLIGRTAAVLAEREPVQIVDEQAERRRAADRERKRLRKSAESAEDAEEVSPKKEIPPTPPKEKTTPSISEAKASSVHDEKFAEFWIAYPRREGPNPRKPAKVSFIRLVAKGASPDAIIAAAKALALEHPTPTRFVPQAVTWLNQERFGDDTTPLLEGDEFCAADWPNTKFLIARFRQENNHDPPSEIHGGKAGYLLPAEWVAISKQQRASNA